MRILFVGFQDSIHVAQWINLLDRTRYDVHLYFPYLASVHEELHSITVHAPRFVHLRWESGLLRMIGSLADYLEGFRFTQAGDLLRDLKGFCQARTAEYRAAAMNFDGMVNKDISVRFTTLPVPTILAALAEWYSRRFRPQSASSPPYGSRALRNVITKIRPDVVHSMELQLNGYLVMQAREGFGPAFPIWVASNYGSDLYYFAKLSEHKAKLVRLLSQVDYYSCECRRDIGLALELDLRAKVLSVVPNSGGIDFEKVGRTAREEPTSSRRVIAVKGYENWSGRAILALQALEKCADVLSDYEIVVYRPDVECSDYVRSRVDTRLRIRLQPPTSHANILELFGRTRLYVGVSLSDGLSTSMLEAMSMGAFPIQTCTSCAEEWLENGRSGFVVPVDIDEIAGRIRQAVADDRLVDLAARENWRICSERANSKDLGRVVMSQYDAMKEGVKADPGHDPSLRHVSNLKPFRPKVSIIIPVYNGSKYVRDAIEDALNQSYDNCEVLVIDDGSTDDTRQIVESYGNRLQYFWKPNGGVASALNVGIERMTGDYFSWLSHDDGYMPEKISCQVEYLQVEADREGVVLYSDYEVMDHLGKTFHVCRWDHEMLRRKPLYGLLRGLIHGCSLLIPRVLFSRIGRFSEALRVTQDYDLWFDMMRKVTFKHIPQVLVRSRWHPDQDSKTKSTQHVIPECNALWIKFQTSLTTEEILSCEESQGRFFWELARFLETTPYDKAREFAYARASEHSSDLTVSVILSFDGGVSPTQRALESALKQTHQHLQIVIVEDEVTDRADELRAYASRDPRVVWVRQESGGSNAKNAGLSEVTGDFIAFLNADCSWPPNKVEVQLQKMVANNWAISHTSYSRVSDEGKTEVISASKQGERLPELIAGCTVSTSTVMARRDLFDKRRFPEGLRFGGDIIAWLDIAAEVPVWGIDLSLMEKHVAENADTLDSKKRMIEVQNICSLVSSDPRFEKYSAEIQRLASETKPEDLEAPAVSPVVPPKTGGGMKSILKKIVLLLPPVREYVENHRAVVRDLEICRERERMFGDRAAQLEALVSEVTTLRAALDRLTLETCETKSKPEA